jgi:excisionase family DNA binding protein
MSPVVYEAPEVARLLNVKVSRVYDLARKGLIPSVRLGRHVKVPIAAFEAWLAGGGTALPGGWRVEPESHV